MDERLKELMKVNDGKDRVWREPTTEEEKKKYSDERFMREYALALALGKGEPESMGETEDEPEPSFTPAEARKRILDDAITAVCSDRCEMYGEVEDNFGVIAGLWNEYLKAITGHLVDLTPNEVAEMMILFKVGRSATALEDHRDTYVDIAGYAACAGGMCE